MANTYEYEIGATAGARQNVEDLIANAPAKGTFSPHSVLRTGGDGVVEGDGFPTATWEFNYLPQADYNTLIAFITGASSAVSIRTRKTDGTYQAYATAVMHRPKVPQEAVREFLGYRNITIRFTRLEV